MASSAAHLGLVSGMGLRPLDDLAGAHHRLALIQRQDRQIDLPREPLDLVAAPTALAPGPGHPLVAGQVPDLVLIPGFIERLRRASAGVPDGREVLLLAAGEEDHAARLSRRASTSGTCSR